MEFSASTVSVISFIVVIRRPVSADFPAASGSLRRGGVSAGVRAGGNWLADEGSLPLARFEPRPGDLDAPGSLRGAAFAALAGVALRLRLRADKCGRLAAGRGSG